MTFGKWREASATWSPDGRRFAYMVTEPGHYHVHVKDLVTGADEEVSSGEANGLPTITSWSSDGEKLLCTIAGRTSRADITWFSFADRKMHVFLATPSIESNARFSPDGKWVAYQSSESGSGEVYVAPFPPTGAKWQVSAGGGNVPRWRSDGRELFYVRNPLAAMIAVPVTLGSTPVFGQPVRLFSFVIPTPTSNLYDVTRDGNRFLINTRIGDEPPPEPLVVVQHFASEVRTALAHRQ